VDYWFLELHLKHFRYYMHYTLPTITLLPLNNCLKLTAKYLKVLNWTLFARCYGWGATSEYQFKSAILLQRGQFHPKFQVKGVTTYQPFFLSQNQGKWSFMWYKNAGTTFFHFVTNHAFDRKTDRQTDRQNSHHYTASAFHAAW